MRSAGRSAAAWLSPSRGDETRMSSRSTAAPGNSQCHRSPQRKPLGIAYRSPLAPAIPGCSPCRLLRIPLGAGHPCSGELRPRRPVANRGPPRLRHDRPHPHHGDQRRRSSRPRFRPLLFLECAGVATSSADAKFPSAVAGSSSASAGRGRWVRSRVGGDVMEITIQLATCPLTCSSGNQNRDPASNLEIEIAIEIPIADVLEIAGKLAVVWFAASCCCFRSS